MNERPHVSISVLHKQWAKLEDEHYQLAKAISEAQISGTDPARLRQRQIELLLEITSIVAEICDAPATTTEDFIALLDVALDHELDLATEHAAAGILEVDHHLDPFAQALALRRRVPRHRPEGADLDRPR